VLHCEELSIPREYEGRLIQAVRFEPPLQPVTREDLARLVPFQPGAPLRQGDIRDAIKRLYTSFRLDRHFDMRFALIALAFGWANAAQNIVDRVAVVVGNEVITESEVNMEARLTAFFNGTPLDLSVAQRKAAAERLVDQLLIRNEMQIGGYPMPPASDGDATLRNIARIIIPASRYFVPPSPSTNSPRMR